MAIAFDASSQGSLSGNPTGTTLTYSHTCSAGSDRFLIVTQHTYSASGDIVSGITYAGQGMTRLATKAFTSDASQRLYFYYLANPASGANNVQVSLTTGASFSIMYSLSASYTGVKQTGYPDAQSNGAANSNADIVGTVTTIADNAWTVMLTGSDDDNSNTAGANTTIRVSSSGAANPNRDTLSDGNSAKTPAGSVSLTITPSATTAGTAYIIASMAPATAAATVNNLSLLGVGA
jgi:hypothetical protein